MMPRYARLGNLGLILGAVMQWGWPSGACAGDWPGWRGPTGCGTADEKGLPLKWDGKTGEGVAWKVALTETGHSSPIVWGDRVFITSATPKTPAQEQRKEIPDHFFDCYRAADIEPREKA